MTHDQIKVDYHIPGSCLVIFCQVLSELVLGQEPGPDKFQDLQAELSGLSLEEALSEVVYQVQDKLAKAAAAIEAAEEKATRIQGTAEQSLGPVVAEAAAMASGPPLKHGSREPSIRVASPRVSGSFPCK